MEIRSIDSSEERKFSNGRDLWVRSAPYAADCT